MSPVYDNFVKINFSSSNLDRYLVRTAILKALQNNMQFFSGSLLDVGCGKMPYRSYIFQNSGIINYTGLDIESALEYDAAIKPDTTWDGINMPFDEKRFNTVMATEVMEHCPHPEIVLGEVNRVLKPGGVFFFTVPFLWPLHETPHDEYRYTPFALKRLLEKAGFNKIQLAATGGWHSAMAQMLGLWVRRSPLNRVSRKTLSVVLKPVIKYLVKKDSSVTVEFTESQMITGLSGIAYKK